MRLFLLGALLGMTFAASARSAPPKPGVVYKPVVVYKADVVMMDTQQLGDVWRPTLLVVHRTKMFDKRTREFVSWIDRSDVFDQTLKQVNGKTIRTYASHTDPQDRFTEVWEQVGKKLVVTTTRPGRASERLESEGSIDDFLKNLPRRLAVLAGYSIEKVYTSADMVKVSGVEARITIENVKIGGKDYEIRRWNAFSDRIDRELGPLQEYKYKIEGETAILDSGFRLERVQIPHE